MGERRASASGACTPHSAMAASARSTVLGELASTAGRLAATSAAPSSPKMSSSCRVGGGGVRGWGHVGVWKAGEQAPACAQPAFKAQPHVCRMRVFTPHL